MDTSILEEVIDQICKEADNPDYEPITELYFKLPTCFSALNYDGYAIRPQELVVLATRPGMGKTAFINNLALSTAENGLPTIYLSFSLDQKQLILKLLAIQTNSSVTRWRLPENLSKYLEAAETLQKLPLRVCSSTDFSLDHLREQIKQMMGNDNRHALVIIDDLHLVLSEPAYIEAARKLKLLARELDISVVITTSVSHWIEKRANKRPILGDVQHDLGQWADKVLSLYMESYYDQDTDEGNLLELLILKNRSGDSNGTAELIFDSSIGKIVTKPHNFDFSDTSSE